MNGQPTANTCGPCRLCCKVMGVKDGEFDKPKDTWCQHAKCLTGCAIYENRPSVCRSFTCLWVDGRFGGPEFRPDKIHGVVTPTTDGRNFVIHEDPGYAGHARQTLKPVIEQWLKRGQEYYVIVVCGSKRSFLGQRETYDQLKAAGSPEVRGDA